ncbi:MAG: OmpA family protein [Pseudomonadota bacterium]
MAIAIFAACAAKAADLTLPSNARQTATRDSAADSYAAPVAAFADGTVPSVILEGTVTREAWRIASPGLTTLQVLGPLRTQLQAAGYEVILDCDQRSCGGFDFRFAVEALPAPNMYVNVRAFRFLTAIRGPQAAPQEAVTLFVSTTQTAAYIQIIQAGQTAARARSAAGDAPVPSPGASGFGDQLLAQGHIVLEGLTFATGGAALGDGPFDAMAALAAFLQANPGLQIALVGHTDSVGSLDGNIALSRSRARAVRTRLIDTYGIDPGRIQAEGMGYLAPVASNLEEAGRQANRRVEAVLLSAR